MKVVTAVLLVCSAAAAAPAVLTMDEAVARALRNHPETRAVRAAEAVAAAQMAVAQAWRAPEFRFSRNNFDLDEQTLEERSTVGLRFSVPRPREMALKQQAARARQQGAAAESRAAEARLAVETRLAFCRAALAEERMRIAGGIWGLRRDLQKTVLRQVSAGLKEADESELIELTVAEAQNELRRAEAVADGEKRKLVRLIGGSDAGEWTLALSDRLFESPAALADKSELTARAAASRAELDALASECRQYQAAEALAKNERYPWLSFAQVSYRTTTMADRGAWGFQLGVDLPLFRTAASAQARVAAAQRSRCELEKQALQARIESEVEDRAASLEDLRRELIELERLRTGPAERALVRMRAALETGRVDQVEVLNAEARVLGLQERWLERRMQYAVVEAQVEASLGEALSRY